MSNNLCQTFSSVAISAGIVMATFTAVPLPNASSSFFPVAISQECTSSMNLYQQFFAESPRQQAQSFFGELRDFTEREQHLYQAMIAKASKPLGINIFSQYE